MVLIKVTQAKRTGWVREMERPGKKLKIRLIVETKFEEETKMTNVTFRLFKCNLEEKVNAAERPLTAKDLIK